MYLLNKKLPSLLDDCKVSKSGSKGVIMVHSQLSDNIFTISMIPESKMVDFKKFFEKQSFWKQTVCILFTK